MSSPVKLVIDRQAKQLVSYLGSVTSIPALFQSNVQDFIIQIVDPTGNLSVPNTIVDMGGKGLRVSVGATPTGSSGGPTPLALIAGTWDSTNKWFTAALALNTTDVDTYIGSLSEKSAYFELNITESGNRNTILQSTFTIRAVVDELGSTVPSPTDQYLTRAESEAAFLKKKEGAGITWVAVSPNGIYGRELGVADDGTAIDNIIVL